MAMHVALHNNDILPNSFPPHRPTQRGHGMVSDYEPHIIMHNTAHALREIEGGVPYEKDEEFPMPQKPKPLSSSGKVSDLFETDPALCVTPEKQRKPFIHTQKLKGSSGDDTLKTSQRVRFDQTVEVKHMSPETPADVRNSLEASVENKDHLNSLSHGYSSADQYKGELSLEYQHTDSKLSSGLLKSGTSTIQHDAFSEASLKLASQSDEDDQDDPISIVAKDVSRLRLAGSDLGSEEGYLSDSSDKEVASILNPVRIKEAESVLARPEFNSVLLLSEERRHLEDLQPDVIQAAQKKLRVSNKDKTKVEEKVSMRLNQEKPQFKAVVSLDVCKDDVKSYHTKVKSNAPSSKDLKPEEQIESPPDILEFFTPDLQWETASYHCNINSFPAHGPQTADLDRTYDVYRHARTWEGW